MKIKYAHTNIIAKDWISLSAFYQRVFGCKPVPPRRDIKGEWIDKLTNMKDVHITGEHLSLPGYEEFLPTLEIFSYNTKDNTNPKGINTAGLAHLAFEVEDVESLLEFLIKTIKLYKYTNINQETNSIIIFYNIGRCEWKMLIIKNFSKTYKGGKKQLIT